MRRNVDLLSAFASLPRDIIINNWITGSGNLEIEPKLKMALKRDSQNVQAWLVGSGVASLAAAIH